MSESQFLAVVPESQRQQILQLCRRARFNRGDYIFHAGEAGDSLHLIVKGRVAVLATGFAGETFLLSVLGIGEVFGEMAFVDERHQRSATVQAIEPTTTLVLLRDDWEGLRRAAPSVDRFLVVTLASRVRRLTGQALELVEHPASVRVYRRLIELAHTFEVATPNGVVPITQEQLASMAGTKLRVTSKVLGEARRDGLLTTGNRRITLIDLREIYRRAHLPARDWPGLST